MHHGAADAAACESDREKYIAESSFSAEEKEEEEAELPACLFPVKILSPFLPTAPLPYVPKIRFTQATIDCLTINKTKNALHKETVILNYIIYYINYIIANI